MICKLHVCLTRQAEAGSAGFPQEAVPLALSGILAPAPQRVCSILPTATKGHQEEPCWAGGLATGQVTSGSGSSCGAAPAYGHGGHRARTRLRGSPQARPAL